jgi:flagellar hook-basal body complex protein FliE
MALPSISLSGLSPGLDPAVPSPAANDPPSSPGFRGVLDHVLQNAAQSHAGAEAAVRDLALGQTDNLHQAMLQMAQADLSFRLVLEVRNRLTEAYQEIMRMQM